MGQRGIGRMGRMEGLGRGCSTRLIGFTVSGPLLPVTFLAIDAPSTGSQCSTARCSQIGRRRSRDRRASCCSCVMSVIAPQSTPSTSITLAPGGNSDAGGAYFFFDLR